jgi:CheY-like chemotaxis protein
VQIERSKALIQTVSKISIFKGLSPSQAQKILGLCASKTFTSGEVVCEQNTPSNQMFILISGELGVMSKDGLRMATLKPVTTVGEMGVITRQNRASSIVAIKESATLVIEKKPFDLLLSNDKDIQVKVYRNIIEILSSKIVNDNVRVRDHLLEKVRSENLFETNRRKFEIALDLMTEKGGMTSEEAKSLIDERMMGMTLRILVVDDDPGIRRFIKDVLSFYEVVEAGDGEEALSLCEKVKPNLVITDIRMPKMDGYQLLSKLREEHPELPVLALSGIVGPEEVQEYDFSGFIDKPVHLEEFRKAIEDALVKEEE